MADCFDEDYVAWADMSLGVPQRKSDHTAIGGRWWEVNERLFLHIKPEEINVRGDPAIVLSIYTATVRDGDTGEVTTRSEARTDVCVK